MLTCPRPSLHPHRWNFPFFFFFQTLIKAPAGQQWIHCLLKSKIQAVSSRHWLPPRAPAAHPSWMGCTGGTSTYSIAPLPHRCPCSPPVGGFCRVSGHVYFEAGTPRPPLSVCPLSPAGPQSHKWPLCSSEEGWPRSAEAPPQVHTMVLDLEVISERVQASNPQMLIPLAPSRKRLPGDNTKPRLPPGTHASPQASPTVCLT